MAIISPAATIVVVFAVVTLSLGLSVKKDLDSVIELNDWKEHLHTYLNTSPQDQEQLLKDVNVAVSAILQSDLSVFLLVQWCFSAYALFALATVTVFLGRLTSRETSRLSERLVKFVIFKVVFCGALIIPDIYEIVLWLAWFAMVGYMRIFMGAAKDRLEALSVSPSASTSSHVRSLALVLVILVHDIMGLAALVTSLGSMSMTKVLLCAFDMAIVLVEGVKTLLRYAVHVWDHHVAMSLSDEAPHADDDTAPGRTSTGWESWEGKGALLYHTELVADVLVHSMTLAHYLHVWFLHGLSFQIIDAILFLDIRSILVSMHKRIRGYLHYRHATHSLRHAFPDAVPQAAHEQCTICMERMATAKQLPCGHHFHLACLRAWLQQSGSQSFACPLCRTPLLRDAAQDAHPLWQHRRRHWPLLDAAVSLVSRLYLDVLFALLLGLPLSAAMLQPRHADPAARGHGRSTRDGSGRRRGGRRERVIDTTEHVGENDQPGPRDLDALQRESLVSRLLGMLLGRRHHNAAPAIQLQSPLVQEVDSLGEHSDGTTAEEEEEEWVEREEDVEFDSDEVWPDTSAGYERLPETERLGQHSRRYTVHSGGTRQPASSQQVQVSEGARLPPYPPPYPEPRTWSEASLQVAAHQVAQTIRSSLGMGVHGLAAVAGHDQHSADQEAESPYQGHASRQGGSARMQRRRRSRRQAGRRLEPPMLALGAATTSALDEIQELGSGEAVAGVGQRGRGGSGRRSGLPSRGAVPAEASWQLPADRAGDAEPSGEATAADARPRTRSRTAQ